MTTNEITALAREFGISRETLYQYLRQNARREAKGRLNARGDK
jgi:DNA-binding phage protein